MNQRLQMELGEISLQQSLVLNQINLIIKIYHAGLMSKKEAIVFTANIFKVIQNDQDRVEFLFKNSLINQVLFDSYLVTINRILGILHDVLLTFI
jgi:hypothetical protein